MKSIRYTSSPLLAARTPAWRSRFMLICMALAFLGMVGRAVWVQVLDSAFFKQQGDVRFVRTLEIPAHRGRILDRNGQLLATSVEAPSIWASPADADVGEQELRQVASLLEVDPDELRSKLADRSKSFVWIRRQVEKSVADQVAALELKGFHQEKTYRREYPEGRATAHVVGFTDVENHGLEGVELSFDSRLSGRPGSRRVLRDSRGRVVEVVGDEVPPFDGEDIVLSIDSKVQFFTYQKLREAVKEHQAKSGTAVVLDARTGEVLAMVNYPSYDPAQRGRLSGSQMRNIAITDTFEPGSTMKPITAAMAMQSGAVSKDTLIETAPGTYRMSGFTIRDTHNYGTLTVGGVVQKSSNVGALKIAQKLSPQYMWETYSALGYGRKPDLAFPGAASGKVRGWKNWRPVEQATMSYGYGLSASLLQMTHAYTAFANGGRMVPLSLLKRRDGQAIPGVQVFSPQVASDIRQMLEMAAAPGGTARQAQTVAYTVGGKTGTARKQTGSGYSSDKYRSWFVGMAPIVEPRIIMGVMVDEPVGTYYGGTVAAPVFSSVVQRTLRDMGVRPDKDVVPQIVAGAGMEAQP